MQTQSRIENKHTFGDQGSRVAEQRFHYLTANRMFKVYVGPFLCCTSVI